MSDLHKALLAVQAEAPKIQKDGINPHFKSKYVRLESIMDAILPILNRHGIVLVQSPTMALDVQPALRTELIHAESGEKLADTMPLVLPAETPQGQGSALTYARRYAVMAMLGLVGDEDDDGEAASKAKRSPREKPKSAAEVPATPGQRAQLKTQLKLLDNAFPEHPGEGRTWADTAAGHMRTRWKKTDSKMLTKAEMNELISWLEDQFREADQAEKVPFG